MPIENEHIFVILRKYAGRKDITLWQPVNYELNIHGDDAVDPIKELHNELGTSFDGMNKRKYFTDDGGRGGFLFLGQR